jgi:hypothetical protein
LRLTTCPLSYSAVDSPRYQTLPPASWAYQSSVSSTAAPSCVTTSCTTRAVMPLAIFFVSFVTVISTSLTVPLVSVSRYTQRVPGAIGQ